MIKGMDLSTLLEVEACGGRFYDHGIAGDAMEILQRCGMNLVRLRLWNHPYTPEGKPFGAGTCDLPRVMTLARRAKHLGVDWLLDFHYSDFWADPGKQVPPRAWQGLDLAGLEQAVYQYTKEVLTTLAQANLTPAMVAVGNELSNGLLWPTGKTPHFDAIARLVSAGIRAVREIAPASKVMVHLDNGGNNALYRNWFDSYLAEGGVDFDIIGLSYYPFWHGSMEALSANMNDIALRYGKDLIVAETSTGFTTEDYACYEQLPPEGRKGMGATAELAEQAGVDMTPEGQSAFLQRLMETIQTVPEGRGKGFIYWEPCWLPVPGSQWASDEAIAYMKEKGPGGNEWANQALFDYEGNSLPALTTIRDFPG